MGCGMLKYYCIGNHPEEETQEQYEQQPDSGNVLGQYLSPTDFKLAKSALLSRAGSIFLPNTR